MCDFGQAGEVRLYDMLTHFMVFTRNSLRNDIDRYSHASHGTDARYVCIK